MAKSLVIVESPAKAKTIKKYLGKNYQIMASVGHIKDLPKSKLGVDLENDFEPTYEVIRGKKKIIDDIVAAAKKVDTVYLAPDPDREGEAIAWHVAESIRGKKTKAKKDDKPKIYRALFNEITAPAIKEAIANPVALDSHLFEAQQARRILDRLVGYKISPLLWDKVRRGLSAGRVQSVAVRIVCEREDEIGAFQSQEYWSVVAQLEGSVPPPFEAKLIQIDGKKLELVSGDETKKVVEGVQKSDFLLTRIERKERKRNPVPPFITSHLQQEASRKLGFTAKKTMMLAQRLYEGIDIGEEGPVGLITYMRTDSTRVAGSALTAVRDYIVSQYGKQHLPAEPNTYKSKKGAQDAHEAIRPTSLEWTPERVQSYLENDMFRLYELIWKRFVASQMVPAIYDQTSMDIEAGKSPGRAFLFRATGSVLKFAGYMAVYLEGVDEETAEKEEGVIEGLLPDLKEGEKLKLLALEPHQHFTQAPPRYTEASLVKVLEELGIGRPSTYAQILSTIQDKEYAKKIEKKFQPTTLGKMVNTLLVKHFPGILNVRFTAMMEQELDEVEEGKRKWVEALKDFYDPFKETLAKAEVEMENIKQMQQETDVVCKNCGAPMVVRWGRHGEFLACSKYPECKTTMEFERKEESGEIVAQEQQTYGPCEKCGNPMVMKRGKFGPFLACSNYPECKTTKAIPVGVKCPKCGGDVVQRRSRRGTFFYGCGKYPACDFVSWSKPVPEECPQCHNPFLVEKYSQKLGAYVACPQKECGYTREPE